MSLQDNKINNNIQVNYTVIDQFMEVKWGWSQPAYTTSITMVLIL